MVTSVSSSRMLQCLSYSGLLLYSSCNIPISAFVSANATTYIIGADIL